MKTIKLSDHPPVTRERVSDILSGAVVIAVLLFGRAALNGAHAERPAPEVIVLKPALAIITATPAPTWTPAPTQTPRIEVQQIIIQATPEVVYVESPPVTSQEAPGAPGALPQVVEDEPPTLAPQQLSVLDRQQWAMQAATARAGR